MATRIKSSDAARLGVFKKRSKYGNRKVTTPDGVFDSEKEYGRWVDLRIFEKAGHIRDLQKQVTYRLEVNGVLITKYIADFVYTLDGVEVVEDVKGYRTRVYVMKRKLMLAVHGITIQEWPPRLKKPRRKRAAKITIKNK